MSTAECVGSDEPKSAALRQVRVDWTREKNLRQAGRGILRFRAARTPGQEISFIICDIHTRKTHTHTHTIIHTHTHTHSHTHTHTHTHTHMQANVAQLCCRASSSSSLARASTGSKPRYLVIHTHTSLLCSTMLQGLLLVQSG